MPWNDIGGSIFSLEQYLTAGVGMSCLISETRYIFLLLYDLRPCGLAIVTQSKALAKTLVKTRAKTRVEGRGLRYRCANHCVFLRFPRLEA